MVTPCAQCMTDTLKTQLTDVGGRLLCASCVRAASPSTKELTHPLVLGGALTAVAPFFLQMSSSSSVTVNDEVVEAVSRDYVALAGGGLALLIVAALAATLGRAAARTTRLQAMAVIAALSVLQLVRGFGLL